MPMIDMLVKLVVAPGNGAAGPDHAITFTVPADGQPGFTPTAGQSSKLNTVLNQFAVAISNNGTAL